MADETSYNLWKFLHKYCLNFCGKSDDTSVNFYSNETQIVFSFFCDYCKMRVIPHWKSFFFCTYTQETLYHDVIKCKKYTKKDFCWKEKVNFSQIEFEKKSNNSSSYQTTIVITFFTQENKKSVSRSCVDERIWNFVFKWAKLWLASLRLFLSLLGTSSVKRFCLVTRAFKKIVHKRHRETFQFHFKCMTTSWNVLRQNEQTNRSTYLQTMSRLHDNQADNSFPLQEFLVMLSKTFNIFV